MQIFCLLWQSVYYVWCILAKLIGLDYTGCAIVAMCEGGYGGGIIIFLFIGAVWFFASSVMISNCRRVMVRLDTHTLMLTVVPITINSLDGMRQSAPSRVTRIKMKIIGKLFNSGLFCSLLFGYKLEEHVQRFNYCCVA